MKTEQEITFQEKITPLYLKHMKGGRLTNLEKMEMRELAKLFSKKRRQFLVYEVQEQCKAEIAQHFFLRGDL